MNLGELLIRIKYNKVESAIIVAATVLIALTVYELFQEFYKEEFTLKKANWECTQRDTYVTYVPINGSLIPQINTDCIQYTRTNN